MCRGRKKNSLCKKLGISLDCVGQLSLVITFVWYPKAIPCHFFVLWLAVQERLSTHVKLLNYGVIASISCVFYRADVESHDYLFFSCPFIYKLWWYLLWKSIIIWLEGSWQEIIRWATMTMKRQKVSRIWCFNCC